jgi:rRNA-processing protein FCF1
MVDMMPIRSVSFDTSFLLKYDSSVDDVIHVVARDNIACFVTSTVVSELEQLKVWGRITPETHKTAVKRWKHAHATVIDFRNRFLSDAFGRACIRSMEKHHGVKADDIANDCSIIVSVLKNGIDLFLSEDFHFTSEITQAVIEEVTSAACSEYHQMCGSLLYSVDAATFLEAYDTGKMDLDVVRSKMKKIRKEGKRLGQAADKQE